VPRGTSHQKTELFWALMEFKERLWLAWAVWGKGDDRDRITTLRLLDQALDLVQYRELLNLGELRTLLDDLAAKVPGKKLDNEIAALKQMTLRYDEDGDAASIY
jgi:hypothetical protein